MSDKEDEAPNEDNICNEIVNDEQDEVSVTCDYKSRSPPLRGRNVMIRRKDNGHFRYWLNLSEVEVLGEENTITMTRLFYDQCFSSSFMITG